MTHDINVRGRIDARGVAFPQRLEHRFQDRGGVVEWD